MPLRPASRPGQAETWTRARPCDVRDAVPQVARGACHDVELLLRYGWMGSQIGEEGVLHRRESRWSGCSGSVVLDFNTRHLSEETKQLIFLHADAEACRRREVVHNATLHSSRRSFGIVEVLFFFFEVELRLSNNARCRAGRWQAADSASSVAAVVVPCGEVLPIAHRNFVKSPQFFSIASFPFPSTLHFTLSFRVVKMAGARLPRSIGEGIRL